MQTMMLGMFRVRMERGRSIERSELVGIAFRLDQSFLPPGEALLPQLTSIRRGVNARFSHRITLNVQSLLNLSWTESISSRSLMGSPALQAAEIGIEC
jgi:hypothetical protein